MLPADKEIDEMRSCIDPWDIYLSALINVLLLKLDVVVKMPPFYDHFLHQWSR